MVYFGISWNVGELNGDIFINNALGTVQFKTFSTEQKSRNSLLPHSKMYPLPTDFHGNNWEC